MRNKFKILIGVFLLAISGITYVSCNEEETICKTCNENLQTSKVEFLNKSFYSFRKVNTENNYVDMSINMKSNEIEDFYTLIEQKFNLKLKNIVATTLFTNKTETNNNLDYNIDFNDVIGFISYVKDDTNTLKLKIYKIEKNKLVEGKLSNSLADRISFKDNFKIGLIEFNKNSNTIITFFISSKLPKNKSIRVDIKDKIEEQMNSGDFLFKVKPDDDNCNSCGSKSYGECEYGGTCDEAPCTSDETERRLKLAGINNYNFVQIKDDLHDFRDLYLKNHTGGDKIIKTYYKLSQKLPVEDMSLAQCIKTFDLIVSDIVPLTNKILNNPQSGEILIDQATNQKIILFLSEVKQIFPDIDSKNRVDNLINKINHFSNKSNKFISDNLNDF